MKALFYCVKNNEPLLKDFQGLIVAECEIISVEKCFKNNSKATCLSDEEFKDYLGNKNFLWAIDLDWIHNITCTLMQFTDKKGKTLTRAPQNIKLVYPRYITKEKEYALISIQPKWLDKILIGAKVIELRRSVIKELK